MSRAPVYRRREQQPMPAGGKPDKRVLAAIAVVHVTAVAHLPGETCDRGRQNKSAATGRPGRPPAPSTRSAPPRTGYSAAAGRPARRAEASTTDSRSVVRVLLCSALRARAGLCPVPVGCLTARRPPTRPSPSSTGSRRQPAGRAPVRSRQMLGVSYLARGWMSRVFVVVGSLRKKSRSCGYTRVNAARARPLVVEPGRPHPRFWAESLADDSRGSLRGGMGRCNVLEPEQLQLISQPIT